MCEAYGCPLLGTRSASTSGGGFMCHVHFGMDQGQLQAATFELNRMAWLSNAVRDLRARQHNPAWRQTYERIKHDIALAQRGDLQFKDGENAEAWMVRLEAELAKTVKFALDPTSEQQELAA